MRLRDAHWLLLLLIVALAAYLRLAHLFPPQRGLQALQDYDEGVWDSTAQLMLQGYVPYRDFFATLPPVGIYMLALVLRVVYVPWGSGLGLMATRYASVVYGLTTVVLVYLVGSRLANRAVGLAAAALLAVDGMVIGIDRLAMLEPPLNLFSTLAVLVYLLAFDQSPDDIRSQRVAVLAGLLSGLACLAKTPGMVVILSLLTVSLLRRRWREVLLLALSFALSWLVLSAYFLLQCRQEFLKQVYFFQFLRPPDGVVHRLARLYDLWHYVQSWLTIRSGVVSGVLIASLTLWRRGGRPWLIVLAWAGYTLLLIMINSSYYPQYYAQLAVPLSLLGGGLLDAGNGIICHRQIVRGRVWSFTVGALLFLAILAVGLVRGYLEGQHMAITRMLAQIDSTYVEVADYIRHNSTQDTRVLVFEPNYTFLASRPPAGTRPGRFLVDSYGEMLYVNLGLEKHSLLALVKAVLTGQKGQVQPTFWGEAAQEQVLAALEQAEYVVVDGRARYQLQPQTLAEIQARSGEVFAFGVASLRRVTSNE